MSGLKLADETTRSKTYGGFPGSLEGFKMKVSTVRIEDGAKKLSAHVTGEWWNYCGFGALHTIPIDVRATSWTSERDTMAVHMLEARAGNVDAAEHFMQTILDATLDELGHAGELCDCEQVMEDFDDYDEQEDS